MLCQVSSFQQDTNYIRLAKRRNERITKVDVDIDCLVHLTVKVQERSYRKLGELHKRERERENP